MSSAKNDLAAKAGETPLAQAFTRHLKSKALLDAEARFLAQVAGDLQAEELPPVSEDGLGAMFADFWRFAEASDGKDLGRDLLEIVQDDRPFLVDSIMGVVAEAGLPVRAMFHPIAEVGGKPRSLIQVQLDPVGEDRAPALIGNVTATLADVRVAVDDFAAMKAVIRRAIEELEGTTLGAADADEHAEQLAFLKWLENEHFVFLGARTYEYPRTAGGGYAAEEPLYQPEGSLGVLRDQSRAVLRRASEPAILSQQVRRHLETGPALTVAKSNLRSNVHRRAYMDYVGVKRYGADGLPSGETRFVGLFTADAYETPASEVPLIRRKIRLALDHASVVPGSHNDKRLRHIIETYPRDELFQLPEGELLDQAMGILHLLDRPRLKLFARKDPFDRFISVLLYVPRDRYDSGVRERAGNLIAAAYNGRVSAYYPSFSDAPLARVHYIIGVTPGGHAEPDLSELEGEIAETARTWGDRFEAAVRASGLPTAPALARWSGAFSGGYRDFYGAEEALADLREIDAMGDQDFSVRAFRQVGDSALRFRFKLYHRGGHLPLADVTPILEHMGLRALIEDAFELAPQGAGGADNVWVHEFLLEDRAGEHLVFAEVKDAFEALFTAVWQGRTESDGFNRLVLELGVSWRDAALIRAFAKYRLQSGLDPSQSVQEEALSDNPGIARLILDLFRVKFDPAVKADLPARQVQADKVMAEIVAALQQVESLDADRVLRRLALLVMALKRTNFYLQDEAGQPKPYISFKVASQELDDLPAPKPFREIFVWSPVVEGVHLRFGPVARGGLRWSDRRDDFRTEVLGLVKAQQVKNAVIVPVGSKGGFFPKQLPRGGSADQIRAGGIAAYTVFLSGLLDITDNIDADNEVVRPAGVIAHEGDDPYLVVAADKGTATFSDIANGIAVSYGFWLGDAFASGGSAGYDHKVMGITARGAWEAVKRHFREAGKDIQKEPFTVVGVGDMSGDVFGNGMLLSKQIRLLAAFDHRHIFLDPDPDPAVSWEERDRLFKLPRSSWEDYDKSRISPGGGVFARSLKTIPVTPEVKAAFDLKSDSVSPSELMTAILKARAELLYLGGIGTYVKARRESHADAGDKASDAIRVDAPDLRVKVVGEGANLGLTQAGRIEFARGGGRINTDAIDNSAGVDSSDHEVNIKILTGMVERSGKLDRPARDKLLASMTDDVARHVLEHNYDQTLALSLLQQDAPGEIDNHARFIAELESDGKLDRRVEGLPDAMGLLDLAKAGQGLTRPELAVLLAYGKLDLFSDMIATKGPDDPAFRAILQGYFPQGVQQYAEEMDRHRLRREIIATVMSNEIVNRCGPTFASRLKTAAAADDAALMIGFEAGRRIIGFDSLWEDVEGLDGKASAQGQLSLFRALGHVLRSQTYWMARRAKTGVSVQALVDRYQPAMTELAALTPAILSPFEQKAVGRRAKAFAADGAPEALATAVAALQPLTTAADLIDLAADQNWPALAAARVYHQVGAAFFFDKLRAAAGEKRGGDHYERMAVRRLIEDMLAEQTAVTRAVITFATNPHAGETSEQAAQTVKSWAAMHQGPGRAVRRTVEEIEHAGGGWTFAKLTIANAALRELAEDAGR
ncbi:MAG: NAD-glutamate dehydrogenase [Caulobacteraceae bacterium]|nr:MAG: NAD-glutamate dehydrogenase [Caulobacteraceae bacterium]